MVLEQHLSASFERKLIDCIRAWTVKQHKEPGKNKQTAIISADIRFPFKTAFPYITKGFCEYRCSVIRSFGTFQKNKMYVNILSSIPEREVFNIKIPAFPKTNHIFLKWLKNDKILYWKELVKFLLNIFPTTSDELLYSPMLSNLGKVDESTKMYSTTFQKFETLFKDFLFVKLGFKSHFWIIQAEDLEKIYHWTSWFLMVKPCFIM